MSRNICAIFIQPREPDTILPGALDPKPCAICETPVYSELQQTVTEDLYGKVLCCKCEDVYLGGLF